MLIAAVVITAGLALLVVSADRFVQAAAAVANHLGISKAVIGLVVLGFGTSAPELLIASIAALEGQSGLALGNALGSNITNTTLVLGASALLVPLPVSSNLVRREIPLLLVATGVVIILLADHWLNRWDGIVLCAGLIAALGWQLWLARGPAQPDHYLDDLAQQLQAQPPLIRALLELFISLAVLMLSARCIVWGATDIATALGVSDLLIGLTVVAIGTSLPELAATIACALKREYDLAVGNIVGSNLFNILGVIGIAGLLAPSQIDSAVLARDLPIVAGLSFALLLMSIGLRGGQGRINRLEAALLVSAFLGYMGWIIAPALS